MNIQIGMSCDPSWLCQGIGWAVGLIVLAITWGLFRVVLKEITANKNKKRPK